MRYWGHAAGLSVIRQSGKTFCRYFVTTLALLSAVFTPTRAQTSTGSLHGQIADPSGAVIPNAAISVKGPGSLKIEATSDRTGSYSFKGLVPGEYVVTVAVTGFRDFTRNVTVLPGESKKLDISLQIAVQQNEVTVNNSDPGPDASDPAANANALVIKGKDLDALSDDPDELEAQLQALAGATAGPNGGQIYIDGFTGGKLPPKNAIREIRINQNPFSAEFDKLGYGRIEILTKPGGTNIHGRLFVEGNDSSLNARNPFVLQKPEYYTVLSGVMIGGPVGNKGAFSFVGERRNINDTDAVNAVILDSGLNPVPFNQSIPHPRRLTMLTPRLDFQLSPNNTFFGRYQWYSSGEDNAGPGQLSLGSQALGLRNTEHDLQLSNTQIYGVTLVNNVRLEYRRDNTSQVAQDSTPQISVLGAFTDGGSSAGNVTRIQDHFELHDALSKALSKHFLRVGVRVRLTSETDSSTQNFNGTFTFSSLSAFQITQRGLQQGQTAAQIRAAGGGAGLFTLVEGQPEVSNVSFDAGVFAEDDWRLRPNMTLGYGVRFETQNDIHDHADFAPRIGFAWGLGSSKNGSKSSTVLRAGFGLFYDRFSQSLILNSLRLNGSTTRQFIIASPDFFPAVPTAGALASSQIPSTLYRISPELTTPYTMQTAITLERKVGPNSTVALTYLNSRGVNQLLSRNINAPLPGTFDPQVPGSGIRPLGEIGNLYEYQSKGIFRQNQLTTNFSMHPRSWLRLQGYYVFNYASSDTSGASSFPSNQYDLQSDYGRAAYDVRHRLAMYTSVDLPHGYIFTPFVVATSGRPYDITVGRDLNGDSIFNDRPAFASNLSRPSVVVTQLGAFDTAPIPGEKLVPSNFANGPGLFNVNLRVTKAFAIGGHADTKTSSIAASDTAAQKSPNASSNPLGGTWRPQYTLRFDVVVSNLLNHVNAATPIGNLSSPLFGVPNSLSPVLGTLSNANRRINIQMQVLF